MEVRYPVKVLYTLGTSQLMLARADAIECRPVKPRPNSSNPEVKHASTTLKECLSALCTASPELLADPRTDYSVYALDPLQTPELMVGRGLLTWLMAESGRVVGTIREDYVDGEEMEVLEIRFSLTPTVAVSRAQHASSLQNISQPTPAVTSANPSPPSTPSGQSQSARGSTRIRIKTTARAREKAAAAAAAPPGPKKRGRQKASGSASQTPSQIPSTPTPVELPPSAQDTPVARPSTLSPVPSRSHSRVSSVSSLALSQTQAPSQSQPQSQPRPPTSSGSTSTSVSASTQSSQTSRSQSQTPQSYSPGRSLARLLLAASAGSSNPSTGVGTPMFDSLVEKLKAAGIVPGAEGSTITGTQRQALLGLIGKLGGSSPGKGKSKEVAGEGKSEVSKSSVTSPALTAARSPTTNPSPSPAPSSAVLSAPSPATLAAPSPSTFATPIPPPDSSLGTRKRDQDDQAHSTDPKRARFGLGEGRTSSIANLDSHLAKELKLEDGGYVPVPISPSPSVASPSLSAASPNFTAPSPNLSALSAPSPSLSAISPNISAASPYYYPHSASAPPTAPLESFGLPSGSGTWPSSQPTPSSSQPQPLPPASSQSNANSRSISQPNLFSSDSKSTTNTRKRPPRETPLHAQTDLPIVSGSFITPRDRIGLPRAPPPPLSPAKCAPGPGRAKASGTKKDKKQEAKKTAPADQDDGQGQGVAESVKEKEKAKEKPIRGVSEEEVRVVLASGYYPPGGLGAEHRKLFGAKNATQARADGESEAGGAGSTSQTGPTTIPASNYYRTAGSSNYYRTSESTNYVPPQRAPVTVSRKAPPIPKHSPVALPAISRLPMMMTSPIRATAGRDPDPELEKGRKNKAQKTKSMKPAEPVATPAPAPVVEQPPRPPPSDLNEYSPLKRLLKNVGLGNLGEVLGQGGVLGLKGDAGGAGGNQAGGNRSRADAKAEMIKEQEREIVDLTSDAEEDDVSVPVKAPALAGKPHADKLPEPRTPTRQPGSTTTASTTPPRVQLVQPQFSTPRRMGAKALAPPRLARTSPNREESPLFGEAETPAVGGAYTQDLSSEGLSIPLDLPPSSPPPMSDSDLETGSGADVDVNDMYREAARYTDADSSEGGFGFEEGDVESGDVECRPDPDTELDDDAEGGWNETIRPSEPGPGDSEAAAQGNILEGLGAAGESQLDLDEFVNFLDLLNEQAVGEVDGTPNLEQLGTELEAVLGQTPAGPGGAALDPSTLDFSWLDALGSSDPGEAGLEVEVCSELTGQDLNEILAALGAG